MSAEVQESGGKRGKSKQKKITVRVDFTPMVDMNMLLITFFMLCTTLSKPQTMEISMPSNDKDITENQKSMVKASQAITLLLGAGDPVPSFRRRRFHGFGRQYPQYGGIVVSGGLSAVVPAVDQTRRIAGTDHRRVAARLGGRTRTGRIGRDDRNRSVGHHRVADGAVSAVHAPDPSVYRYRRGAGYGGGDLRRAAL